MSVNITTDWVVRVWHAVNPHSHHPPIMQVFYQGNKDRLVNQPCRVDGGRRTEKGEKTQLFLLPHLSPLTPFYCRSPLDTNLYLSPVSAAVRTKDGSFHFHQALLCWLIIQRFCNNHAIWTFPQIKSLWFNRSHCVLKHTCFKSCMLGVCNMKQMLPIRPRQARWHIP